LALTLAFTEAEELVTDGAVLSCWPPVPTAVGAVGAAGASGAVGASAFAVLSVALLQPLSTEKAKRVARVNTAGNLVMYDMAVLKIRSKHYRTFIFL
jgi:hypothetical protein